MADETNENETRAGGTAAALARKLPFGAPLAAVFAYFFSILVGRLLWGGGHPGGPEIGAMIAIFGLAPLLGGLGLVAAIRGVLVGKRRRLMLFAAVLNLMLIIGPYVLFVST